MTEITKVERVMSGYELECPRCKKKITAVSIKQINHNYKVHQAFCKGYQKE